MRVDSNISNAIESYLAENKIGYADLAQKLGVTGATITKWRKVGSGVTARRWQMLFPLIRPYLPNDRIYIDDSGNEQYSSNTAHQSSYVFEPKYVPLMVPTFTLRELTGYDNLLESVTQFGVRLKAEFSEYRPKHAGKSGIMGIVLDDDALAPVLPKQARLFACAGEHPVNGGLVVAKQANGEAFVGHYHRTGNEFSITSVQGEILISGPIQDARIFIAWVFPVLYYEVVTF